MIDSRRQILASSFHGSNAQLHQSNRQVETFEIALEPDVLSTLCRRGRRRLREIQTSCDVTLKLDRYQGVLIARGSKGSMSMVQKQLEALSGPSLPVSPAVWAELMRTRTTEDPTQAAVARIQQESGCRIHIERDVQQVRLFGGKSETSVALDIFKDFECLCAEETVKMSCPQQIDAQVLQMFAQDAGVTLKVEANWIVVLGIVEAVEKAAQQLRKYDGDRQQQSLLLDANSENTRMAISTAMAELAVTTNNIGSASTTADSLPPSPLPNSHDGNAGGRDKMLQGMVITKMPPPYSKDHKTQENVKNAEHFVSNESFGSCPTCGSCGNFCVHCGKKVLEHRLAGCQTCGVPKFCVYCGQPTQMNMNPPLPFPNGSFENQSRASVPNVGYGDVMQMRSMMSMPMMQMPVQTNNTPTSQSQGLPVMMMMPEAMMMSMCMPVGVSMQGLQGC